ncbi:MAG: hypothetical protein ACT4PE_16510 [Candidatus Eiseniibacteriota bacterium]
MRPSGKGAPWPALCLLPLAAGCASTHYVEVYIADIAGSCELTADMGRSDIDHIYVFPSDVIVWVNATDRDVEISIDPGAVEALEFTLAPGKRAMTPVLEGAGGDSYMMNIECAEGGSSGPKIVVGDPP